MKIRKIFCKINKKIPTFLFIISLLLIVCIKFEACLVPINLSQRYISNINDVLLNLSYGYFISFITYIFTVFIPERQRYRKASLILKSDINIYRSSLITTVLTICEILNIPDFNTNEHIKDYKKEHYLMDKIIKSRIATEKEDFINFKINSLNNEYLSLINKFILLEKSMPEDIYDSILYIMNSEIGAFFSFLDESKSLDSLRLNFNSHFIKLLNEHIGIIENVRGRLTEKPEQ